MFLVCYSQPKGTGRQRKKVAARGKGGEFLAKRKKRRLYALCLGSEIDTAKLDEHLDGLSMEKSPMKSRWTTEMYTDTLRVYRNSAIPLQSQQQAQLYMPSSQQTRILKQISDGEDTDGDTPVIFNYETGERRELLNSDELKANAMIKDLSIKFNDPFVKEVFVFEFGAVVFWGFPAGEEKEMKEMLTLIRQFVTKGLITSEESEANEDDMAFIPTPALEASALSISNDILTLPDDTNAKQRLAMSFAIGQSTVLAVFESRVESKVQDYKYIPESLAAKGKVIH